MDMFDYVKPIQRDFDPDTYILHIGTNNLTTDKKTRRNLLRNIMTSQGS